MKKKHKFNKNKVLKALFYINLYVCIISAFLVGSGNYIPIVVFIVTLSYLFLFAYANNLLLHKRKGGTSIENY